MPYADRRKQLEYKRRWNKKFYSQNKEREMKRIYKRKRKIAKWFEEYKSSLSCEKCGEKNPACLDFHHRIQHKKDFNIALAKNWGWGIERIKREIAKCAILCANCHRKVHSGLM